MIAQDLLELVRVFTRLAFRAELLTLVDLLDDLSQNHTFQILFFKELKVTLNQKGKELAMNVLESDIGKETGINMMIKLLVVVQEALHKLKKGFGQLML